MKTFLVLNSLTMVVILGVLSGPTELLLDRLRITICSNYVEVENVSRTIGGGPGAKIGIYAAKRSGELMIRNVYPFQPFRHKVETEGELISITKPNN